MMPIPVSVHTQILSPSKVSLLMQERLPVDSTEVTDIVDVVSHTRTVDSLVPR